MIVFAIFAGVLGSVVGSFLNVVVYRVPAGRSIVTPRSACGACGKPVRSWDNVPVVSWIVLRGKCRDCAAPISVRYPLVELGTAVLFIAVAVRFAMPLDQPNSVLVGLLTLAAFLYLASTSVVLGLIDIDTNKLPNRIVLPGYVVGAVLLTAASTVAQDFDALLRAAIGAASLFVIYLVLNIASRGGMGAGDVKLAGVLGLFTAWIGFDALIVGALAAFILGGLFGIILVITRKAARRASIPFGPWMLLGAWVGIFWGAQLSDSYLSLFGIG